MFRVYKLVYVFNNKKKKTFVKTLFYCTCNTLERYAIVLFIIYYNWCVFKKQIFFTILESILLFLTITENKSIRVFTMPVVLG